MWPRKPEASGPVNEKRACASCVSAKTRCIIAGERPHFSPFVFSSLKQHSGEFSIRPPRGKLATSQRHPPQDKSDDPMQLISDMKQRWTEQKEMLVTRLKDLEHQVTESMAEVAKLRR